MKNYFGILESVNLFKGIDVADFETMLTCLGAEIKTVQKNEVVLLAGNKPQHVGIVLSGQIHVLKEDYEGNRMLVSALTPSEIFAEALCCADIEESPVTVTASAASIVMLLSFTRILHTCSNSCQFHTQLIANMLKLIANRNLQLKHRMEIVSLKSVRMKVIRYLESVVPKEGHKGQDIAIPFNREELADFLCVERSALSHELSRMKRDGLIEYRKNRFILK